MASSNTVSLDQLSDLDQLFDVGQLEQVKQEYHGKPLTAEQSRSLNLVPLKKKETPPPPVEPQPQKAQVRVWDEISEPFEALATCIFLNGYVSKANFQNILDTGSIQSCSTLLQPFIPDHWQYREVSSLRMKFRAGSVLIYQPIEGTRELMFISEKGERHDVFFMILPVGCSVEQMPSGLFIKADHHDKTARLYNTNTLQGCEEFYTDCHCLQFDTSDDEDL